MANEKNDKDRTPTQELLPKNDQSLRKVKNENVGGIVSRVLDTVWGWNRLTGLVQAQTRYQDSLSELRASNYRYKKIIEIEESEHKKRKTELEKDIENNELEKGVLKHKYRAEEAYYKASEESYKKGQQPPEKPKRRDDARNPEQRKLHEDIRSYVDRLTKGKAFLENEFHRIDKAVEEGILNDEQGQEAKNQIEAMYKSRVLKP